MTATRLDSATDYAFVEERTCLTAASGMPVSLEETGVLPHETLILSIVALAVIGGIAVVLGWEIAAILAAAVAVNGARIWFAKRSSR